MRKAKRRVLPAVSLTAVSLTAASLAASIGLVLTAGGAAMAAAGDAGTPPDYAPQWATTPARNGKGDKAAQPAPAVPRQQPREEAKGDKAAQPAPAPAAAAVQDDTAPGEILWSSGAKAQPAARANPAEMEVPLQEDKFRLGDVKVRVSGASDVSIGKERLVQIMTPLLRPKPAAALSAIPDDGGYIPLTALAAKGFNFRFDAGEVALFADLSIEQRAKGKLSASTRRERVASGNMSKPALFAAYVNVHAGADYVDQSSYGATGMQNVRLDLQGAARWFNLVLEGEAAVETDGGLSRRGTRVIYDMPEDAVRIIAGDVTPLTAGFQAGAPMLGLSVEKDYKALQPGANIRPTSGHSFRIDRPSSVDIKINGFVTQRLHLRPGDYDLSDLPLTSGANDIALEIEDDAGQKRTLAFSVFSGMSLLAPGISEWAVSTGVASHMGQGKRPCPACGGGSQLEYDFDAPMVTGFYQRGLTETITGSAHFQTDTSVFMGGAGAMFATSFGFWGVDGAMSESIDFGPGFAAHAAYELANIQMGDGVRRSVRLAGEYHSENFAVMDVIAPRNDTMFNLSASYSQDLPWDLSGSLAASYAIGRDGYGDGYGVDVSLGRNFGSAISAGLTMGYEQAAGSHCTDAALQRDGVRAAMRLNYRLDEKSSIDTAHDTRDGRSQVAYRRQEGSGVGSWSTQVELDRQPAKGGEQDQYNVNGSASYVGNRADVSVSHYATAAGLDTARMEQRSSVTVGTAFAFADGLVAVGRPVSNSFAIVAPHESLSGSDVAVGSSQDSKRAGSGFLGPALVNDVSSYSQSRLPVDVSDLPPGYDLGAGGFDLYAPYKSGYRLTVGSDYTVTALGVMTTGEGEPITLLTGDAHEDGVEGGRHVEVFTNRVGKFYAQGLRPGRWLVDMATEPKTRFVIDIPKGTKGLWKPGTLKPAKNG